MEKLSDFCLNRENPFAKQALARIGEHLVTKKVLASNQDERAILKAVDDNGEILGNTVFARNIVLDDEKFGKFFLGGFSVFFDLKPSSLKVFKYIIELLLPNRDDFNIYIDEAMKKTQLSRPTIFRALAQLCRAEVIARGGNETQYYINPMIMFNGNRVTFATTYILKNCDERYHTTPRGLKETIKLMQKDGVLPTLPKVKDDLPQLPFADDEAAQY